MNSTEFIEKKLKLYNAKSLTAIAFGSNGITSGSINLADLLDEYTRECSTPLKEQEGREVAETIINKLRLSEHSRPVDLDIIRTFIEHRYN